MFVVEMKIGYNESAILIIYVWNLFETLWSILGGRNFNGYVKFKLKLLKSFPSKLKGQNYANVFRKETREL